MSAKKARKTGGKREQGARKTGAKGRTNLKKSAPPRGRSAKAAAKKITKKATKKAAKGRSSPRAAALAKKVIARKSSTSRPARPGAKAPAAQRQQGIQRGAEPAPGGRRLQSLAKDRPAKHLRGEAGIAIETADRGPGAALNVQGAGAVDVLGMVQARDLSREVYSERSKGQRLKNIHAATADTRIRGHAMGAHRAAQAKRDAQQGGE